MNEGHPASRLGQHCAQRELPNSVHGVDDHPKPRLTNLAEVNQPLHRVDILVRKVALFDDFCLQGQIKLELDHIRVLERIGFFLDLPRLVIKQQRPITMKHLQPIPLGRIVTRGKRQPVRRSLNRGRIRNQRGRCILGQQDRRNVVASEHLR